MAAPPVSRSAGCRSPRSVTFRRPHRHGPVHVVHAPTAASSSGGRRVTWCCAGQVAPGLRLFGEARLSHPDGLPASDRLDSTIRGSIRSTDTDALQPRRSFPRKPGPIRTCMHLHSTGSGAPYNGTSAARRNGRSDRDFVAAPVHPHSTPVATRRCGRSRVFTSFRLEPFAQTQLRTHQASR